MEFATCIIVLNSLLGGAALQTVDFADLPQQDAWLRHPVFGDPSFDAFEHAPANPVHRGAPPYEWPVNGFLFEDTRSTNWYLYVGNYCQGYQLKADLRSHCTVYQSGDRGESWEALGPIFADEPHFFDNEVSPLASAPDVSVTFDGGRYHLCFDWTTANTTWKNAADPPPDANSGVGYAWAEKPEGPFHIAKRPIATTRDQVPLLGKYRRLYASTILRRSRDWLVLTLTDSGPCFGWALLGMTAEQAEGPYTPPKLLLYPESPRFHPPLLEFFPAFVHEGFVYAPATSVALNRNCQTLFRVPIEKAMDPEAWAIHQLGSLWHAAPAEHEAYGIWGQTFSGFVDGADTFHVMFPSRDRDGMGTINLATRPWRQPCRPRGFVLSGHEGPSLARLRRGGPIERIELTMALHGTATILWDHSAPLGPNRPASNATLHPLTLSRCEGLRLSPSAWTFLGMDELGEEQVAAQGELEEGPNRTVRIAWSPEEVLSIQINGSERWAGKHPRIRGNGALGLLAHAHSHVTVERFEVKGALDPIGEILLYTEALLGAAQNMANWEDRNDRQFRYGIGAVSKNPGVEAKWNFQGSGFKLWAPKGPEFGTASLYLDGESIGQADFHAPKTQPSAILFSKQGLEPGFHALTIRPEAARIPVDALDTLP